MPESKVYSIQRLVKKCGKATIIVNHEDFTDLKQEIVSSCSIHLLQSLREIGGEY